MHEKGSYTKYDVKLGIGSKRFSKIKPDPSSFKQTD